MYCQFCGAELENGSKFCRLCGKPQSNETPKCKKDDMPSVRLIAIGIVFILEGILPYLLSGDAVEYNNYLRTVYNNYDAVVVSALVSFCSSFFTHFFYILSSLIAVYTGFLILKKKDVPKASVVVSLIIHTAAILYIAISNIAVYCFPKNVMSLYTNETYLINQGEILMRSEPNLLSQSRNAAILRAVISLVVIALSAVLLVMKKRFPKNKNEKSVKISSAGGIAMIFSLSLLSVAHTVLNRLTAYSFGDYAMAAKSSASSAFSTRFGLPSLLIFVIIIGIAVLFTRTKRLILSLPVILTSAVFVVVGYVMSYRIFVEFYIPVEIFEMAVDNFRGLFVSGALIFVSAFLWFSSVSRNRIPTWLQIVIPLILPIVYAVSEFAVVAVLYINTGISFGAVIVSVILTAVSLAVNSKQHSAV